MIKQGLYYTLVTGQTEKEQKINERRKYQDDNDNDEEVDDIQEQIIDNIHNPG